ncbi:MAG: protein translocase subunit SecD [Betaproteobacteria bacterium]|nr:protein translocase subunit SecD [Betaproteobacteria bacterium]NBT11106.1 protein translocase subunit SecD [Betaproteobacteria bacterium]NBU49650.1 protein translocase subunit SecD [Betaproteobacteria bacterium]NBX95825.1 protein translocase subunit SecD [Betaproteobacteria bacterium]
MNRYPVWKYAFILVALFVGVLYTLPNFFGEAPAVQVSSAKVTVKVDFNMVDRVQKVLDDAAIKAGRVNFDGTSVRVRFDDTDTQIKAKDAMARALNPDPADPSYIVALNLLSRSPAWLSSMRALPMYLGLDLRGGVHFLMQVDMRSAVKQQLDAYQSEVRGALREKRIRFTGLTRDGDGLSVVISEEASVNAARDLVASRLTNFTWTDAKVPEGTRLTGRLTPKAMGDIGNQALTQNIETLHKRVNELGVAEPVIQRQGADRVVVQLPGVQDTARAKDIIGRTATLQFRLVDQAGGGSETVPVRLSPGETVQRTVSLKREVIATGEQLEKASATLDQNQRPAVSVNLNDAAGRAMRNVTRENLGKPMAIVLYEKGKGEAVSVATIQGEFGNQFQITGNFTPQETADIALLTRAGALAAPMEIIEERTIGPSLGAENIAKGFNSVIYGFAAIALFMCAYYLLFGVFSTLALAFNLLLLVAVLSMLQATLTLPGIAAIALTLGMAIDANVLINERVREELRNGVPPQSAIHAGYERAWATILDSNVTTLVAGVALLAFGSGPVRGFAVVHCLGILTSMFSAVVFSRALVNLWYGRQKKLKGVSIGQVWRPAPAPAGGDAPLDTKA